jgi:E3 ubiquitin-protein ligase MUL1
VIKVFLGIACVIGFGLAVYIFRKLYKNWKNRRAHERLFEEARRARQAAREAARFTGWSRDTTNGSNNESQECVVCLNNPREVILLNCGHICLCIDCVEALPQPMQCPVCRQSVERFLNTYNA